MRATPDDTTPLLHVSVATHSNDLEYDIVIYDDVDIESGLHLTPLSTSDESGLSTPRTFDLESGGIEAAPASSEEIPAVPSSRSNNAAHRSSGTQRAQRQHWTMAYQTFAPLATEGGYRIGAPGARSRTRYGGPRYRDQEMSVADCVCLGLLVSVLAHMGIFLLIVHVWSGRDTEIP